MRPGRTFFESLSIRPGRAEDIAPLDALLARSFPRLLAADYPPSVVVTAIPRISKAQPRLVTCGTYFVALHAGRLVGAGGRTPGHPRTGGRGTGHIGQIRHFVTKAEEVRSGVGSAIMAEVLLSARAAGVRGLQCLSSRTAVPFYENAGFELREEVDVTLDAGITFPVLRMCGACEARDGW